MQNAPKDVLALFSGREGHFKLESGHHGNLWLNLDHLFLRPLHVQPFAIELARRLASYEIEAVCGPMLGGALLAQLIAIELNVEFYYTERFVRAQGEGLYPVEYRLPKPLQEAVRGKRLAIVDDVINAGSAVRGTVTTLQASRANCVVVSSLLVLGNAAPTFFESQQISMEYLGQMASELWTPSECTLCAMGKPLESLI